MANPNKLTVAPGADETPTLTALLERLNTLLERQTASPLGAQVAEDARVLAALHGLKVEAAAQIEWFVAASARAMAALAALAPEGEVAEPDVGALLADAIRSARPSSPPSPPSSPSSPNSSSSPSSPLTRDGLEGLLAGLMSK